MSDYWKDNLFKNLEAELFRGQYYFGQRTKASREWFMKKIKELGSVRQRDILQDKSVYEVNQPKIGQLFSYGYGPKHWRTLPYYDNFPLSIMVGPAPKGFYGLNLHYLYPIERAIFLDKISSSMTDPTKSDTARLQITYDFLKSSAKYKEFAPCFKHYLTNHVKTKIVRIDPPDWEIAVFLPVEAFKKKSREYVWRESKRMVS